MELKSALVIAGDIVTLLAPFCTLINIAGSCRREKPEVKDIEIVALPEKETIWEGGDMFASPTAKKQNNGKFGMVVNELLGKVIKGNPYGKYMQIELSQGINLDLFMPDDFDYYRQFAIRTGSADYTAKYIASGWKKIGWCGSDKGLRKISDCVEHKTPDNKSRWVCKNDEAEKPPAWNSEEEFFAWLGLKWIHPKERSL